MPTFETSECYAATPARAFDLFRRPAERVRLTPPELHLRLEEGPDGAAAGIAADGARPALGRDAADASEITAFEDGALIVEEQRQGPFRSWRHEQRFAASPEGGVCITDAIEYEPPGGVLGRLATAETIRRELERAFA